jgi:predicted peptidase
MFANLLWTFALLLPLVAAAVWPALADDFEAGVFTNDLHETLPFRLLKPAGYDPAKKYPLVVYLHGAGDRGRDNLLQLKQFVWIFAAAQNRRDYPCFVLAPQCAEEQKWVNVPWDDHHYPMPQLPSQAMELSMQLVDRLEKEFAIDPARLYIAGISMGGYGTWDALCRYPGRFAAAVPICGGGDERRAAAIARIPVWAFHGGQDNVVPPEHSRSMIAALRKAGGKPKYTEYPAVGHDSWVPAAVEPQLLPWLFAQQKG